MINKAHIPAVTAFALMLMLAAPAPHAQAQDLIPPQTSVTIEATLAHGDETHPPLRLTPDKSEIINLDRNVARVIIGNDTHINILTDTTRRMVVTPRAPGATHFMLLGDDGEILMSRHVIVAAPKQQYLRVRQPCPDGVLNCRPTRVFYCPGMCHEIDVPDGSSASSPSPHGLMSGTTPDETALPPPPQTDETY